MLDLGRVDLDEIAAALADHTDYEHRWLINPHVWYQDVADFAERISDEGAGRRLARAINGRGAFRRFKAELHEEYPHLLRRLERLPR